jgi:hypothetical protein
MAFGGRAFGRKLNHEGRAFMTKINSLVKRAPGS